MAWAILVRPTVVSSWSSFDSRSYVSRLRWDWVMRERLSSREMSSTPAEIIIP